MKSMIRDIAPSRAAASLWRPIACAAAALLIAAPPVLASGLTGTELAVQVQYQQTAGSARAALSFETSAIVGDGVEFPNLASLQVAANPFNLSVVPVAVDAGANFIQLDYSTTGSFAAGFFNGYRFTFADELPVEILNATINPATNVSGFTTDRLQFVGNELYLNVASLGYRSNSIILIDLDAIVIPLPGAVWLFLSALGALGLARRYR